jgi:catalase
MNKRTKSANGSRDLDPYRADPAGARLTTNQGVPIADNQNSLRAGERGPTLLEDFILREKITHFDHERIPERVVHARGSAAHGYFQVYKSMASITRAHFLQDPEAKTPVFVRFSTVGGSRGSADTPRDVRGFAVKFYTQEGNYDLVGNNMPVFFIQDAIKFPDFVHAVKPEPRNEIPQASSAHDTLWDFVSLTPETAHMMMWLMSDRAIPRSLRMMEGFGIHTFRFVNAKGQSKYVKFHWKPVLGMHSLVWDEAQKLAGKDPDFNRRDLWEAIENGDYPEWELGVQIFGDKEADSFSFDILDPTKLIPEELIPVTLIGKMVLNKNPDSFFAETEQVAFCASHVVPGIDFTNDPLLMGRIFSYLDTQLTRLGGPNFHELPINRPVCPFSNGQRDGMHRITIDTGKTSYDPNSLDSAFPKEVREQDGGFASYPERIDGVKRRVRSDSFKDHFSQATLFWNSMSSVEKEHIIEAFSFELAKLEQPAIRGRVLEQILANIDSKLVSRVAANLGLPSPAGAKSNARKGTVNASPALSMANTVTGLVRTRKVAILAADGSDGAAVAAIKGALSKVGATGLVLAARLGTLKGTGGTKISVDHTITTMPSVVFDGVYVPGGPAGITALAGSGDAVGFVAEAYRHCKAIGAGSEARPLLERAGLVVSPTPPEGVCVGKEPATSKSFIRALGQHRSWNRPDKEAIVA